MISRPLLPQGHEVKQPGVALENPDGFPLEDLPPALRDSVVDVHLRTQAPIAVTVASALGALSLALQGRVNVQTPSGILLPTSLNLITLTEATIQKTACDRYFMRGINEVHARLLEKSQVTYDRYVKDHTAWKNRRRTVKQQRSDPTAGEPYPPELIEQPPVRPSRIKMISADVTAASIRKNLREHCPFSSLMSNEADLVFKGESASEFAFFNTLWDGKPADQNLRSRHALKVNNARFTLSLTTEPDTLAEFLKRHPDEAQSDGLLARSLMCWPTPTTGWSVNVHPDKASVAIENLQSQLAHWVEESWHRFQERQPLNTVTCTRLAAGEIQSFIQEVNKAMAPERAYGDIAAAAAKAVNNTLRLAALFSQLRNDTDGIIALNVRQAISVMKWYLEEYKRLFGQGAILTETHLDLQRMRAYLQKVCRIKNTRMLSKAFVLNDAPLTLRLKESVEAILDRLAASGEIVESMRRHEHIITCNFVASQARTQLARPHSSMKPASQSDSTGYYSIAWR